ncbi:MAG TPA: hypothetical protein VD761_02215 [Solirubrobacterales bacterium]|nr:hypothetical protein [Solirubrobacterales bacterium]
MEEPASAPELGVEPVDYILARWRELALDNGPWFVAGHGIGLRLRLEELKAVAEALQEGALDERALKVLRNEAREVVNNAKGFLKSRYESLAEKLDRALGEKGGMVPGGRAFGTIAAAGDLLAEPAFGRAIAQELERRSEKVKDWQGLMALDELIELLDAELLFLGHSSAWRRDAVDRVEGAMAGAGVSLAEAVEDMLKTAGQEREMQVVLGLDSIKEPPSVKVQIKTHDEDEAISFIEGWDPSIDEGLLVFPEGAMVAQVDAPDPHAAVEGALEWFAVEQSLWRLQDGEVSLQPNVLVFDQPPSKAQPFERPTPLDLMPGSISAYQELFDSERKQQSEPSILADAFVQLVQARVTLPGAAIADLWSVAESVFSGVATETGSGAGEVMAGLAEHLFVRDVLRWLAEHYRALGLGEPAPTESEAEWALALAADPKKGALQAAEKAPDPLTAVRTSQVAAWVGGGDRMKEDLDWLDTRLRATAARAYLVRNLVVHRSQPNRARALAATLRPFAGLLRECLDYLATHSHEKGPVAAARMASLRVRLLADDYAGAKIRGEGLAPLRAAIDLSDPANS